MSATGPTSNPASQPVPASDIEPREAPRCPACGQRMEYYGGSGGFICHSWKLLYRGGGWFDDDGAHVKDERLNHQRTRDIHRH